MHGSSTLQFRFLKYHPAMQLHQIQLCLQSLRRYGGTVRTVGETTNEFWWRNLSENCHLDYRTDKRQHKNKLQGKICENGDGWNCIKIKPDGLTEVINIRLLVHTRKLSIPASARSEAWVCGHSLAGFAGSNIDADRTDMDWRPLGRGLEKFMGNPSSGIH